MSISLYWIKISCIKLYFTLIINKHFIFCCYRTLAYTTLDRLWAVFLYNRIKWKIKSTTNSQIKSKAKIEDKVKDEDKVGDKVED